MEPTLLRPGEGETIFDGPERTVRILADLEGLTLSWFRYEPGQEGPDPHVHRRHTDAFYVLEGELELVCGGERSVARAGAFAFLPRGVAHTFRVSSPQPARMLVTSAPARFDAFVRELGEPAAREELPVLDGPPDVERLVAVAAKHGVEILGPPGMLPAQVAAA